MGRKIPAPILIMPEEPGGPRSVASGGISYIKLGQMPSSGKVSRE